MKQKKSTRTKPLNLYRLRMAGLMLCADLTALLLATFLGNYLFNGFFNYSPLAGSEIEHIIFLLVCIALFMVSKLYPGVGINPADEIRLVVQNTFTALAISVIFKILLGPAIPALFYTLVLIWALYIFFVLVFRWAARITAARLRVWKEPVLVIAGGERAAYLVRYFRKRLRLGFWPVMVASDDAGVKSYVSYEDEPVINLRDLLSFANLTRISDLGVESAVIDLSVAGDMFGAGTAPLLSQTLPHLIFVSDLDWLEGVSLDIHDFEGLLGVETRKNELNLFELSLKYGMDFLLSFNCSCFPPASFSADCTDHQARLSRPHLLSTGTNR